MKNIGRSSRKRKVSAAKQKLPLRNVAAVFGGSADSAGQTFTWKPAKIEDDSLWNELSLQGCDFIEELDDNNEDIYIPALPNKKKQKLAGPTALVSDSTKQEEHDIAEADSDTPSTSAASDDIPADDEAGDAAVDGHHDDDVFEEDWTTLDTLRPVMHKWLDVLPQFPPTILTALAGLGFRQPTPVQTRVLPAAVLERKDIVAAAETGSGKTLAFGIPIVANLLHAIRMGKRTDGKRLEALIILPSRELATQATSHIKCITKATPINVACVIGGIFNRKQIRILDSTNAEIVIGTPGRLFALMGGFKHRQNKKAASLLCAPQKSGVDTNAMITSRHLSNLSNVRYLVLDEADRLTEDGHFRELTSLLEKLYQEIQRPDQIQSFIVSATMAAPMDKQKLKKDKKTKDKKKKNRDAKELVVPGLSGAIESLLRKVVRLRPKYIAAIDLTLATASPDAKVTSGKRAGAVPVSGTMQKQHMDLKLPESLTVNILRCLETERELMLYAFLSRYFYTSSTTSKVLVFVNAISYVYRLDPLLKLMFNSHPLLSQKKSQRLPRQDGNPRLSESPPTVPKGLDPASTFLQSETKSPGAAILAALLTEKSSSAPAPAATTINYKFQIGRPTQRIVESLDTRSPKIFGIHSKLKQPQRLQRLERFQTPGENSILICTDVAARGLDLPSVDVVIHLQAPVSTALFVHRSGRTARANRPGACVGLCRPSDVGSWNKIFTPLGLSWVDVASPEIMESVSSNQITTLKEQMTLATEVEQESHRIVKEARDSAWFSKAAHDVDMICDMLEEDSDTEARDVACWDKRRRDSKFEAKKRRLQEMLAIRIWRD